MELIPYYDFEARNGKITSILLIGVTKIETDNWGTSMYGKTNFPRIHICYLNGKREKLNFDDGSEEKAQAVLDEIKKIIDGNMKYLIDNNLFDQVLKM